MPGDPAAGDLVRDALAARAAAPSGDPPPPAPAPGTSAAPGRIPAGPIGAPPPPDLIRAVLARQQRHR
jgi:hypothetical protein